jgi:ribonuclease Z
MNLPGDFRVTLLGTGVPTPSPARFGPSTLIEAGDCKLLVDAGRGATVLARLRTFVETDK